MKNRTLLILSFIMVVNALAYGTIIPLLYKYSTSFGLDGVGVGFLFASYSLAQLIATPIIGRLSDRFGRKSLLLLCLAGTAASLAMFASATSVVMLFLARTIDGVTGGNISVAQAMIADTTSGKERAKAFGLLGATFGVGFLIGPAVGGLLSELGTTVPFWFAAVMAAVGTILGIFMLKETLPKEVVREAKQKTAKKGFDLSFMLKALLLPTTGVIIGIGFLVSVAQNTFIIGFQSFTNDALKMSPFQIGLTFTLFGVVNILVQMGGIKALMKLIPSKKTLISLLLILSAVALAVASWQHSWLTFVPVTLLYGMFASPIFAITTGLLSERTLAEDQGAILGINQSYTSLGQVVGPLIAGAVISRISLSATFVAAAVIFGLALLLSQKMYIPIHKKADI